MRENDLQYKSDSWLRKTWKLIEDTPIEIAIGAVALGMLFGGVRYSVLKEKEASLPLAFSEIEQITSDFETKGESVPALTRFYCHTNDISMKVFEASNRSYRNKGENKAFAQELRKKMDSTNNDGHALISEYAELLPQDAQDALRSLQNFINASQKMPAVTGELSATWNDRHHHHYHTEYYYTTSTSNGRTTRTRHSRQVYDGTTHSYDYDGTRGENASRLLNDYTAQYPDLQAPEKLHTASVTHKDNQDAIRESMAAEFKENAPSNTDFLKLANTWSAGSNYRKFASQATSNHEAIIRLTPQWAKEKSTASSTSYRNRSRSDSGPQEFQTVETLMSHSNNLQNSVARIVNGIRHVESNAPMLDRKIREFISVTLEGKTGDSDALREEVMQLARDMYTNNFEGGFNVQPFKWSDVILVSLLGMAVGSAMGAGVNHAINVRKERREGQNRDNFRPY